MKALLLAVACAVPAGAWSLSARTGEAIFEVEATGNPKVDNELADRAAAALRRRLEAQGLSGSVERRAGLRIAAVISSREDDPEILLRPLYKPSQAEFHLVDGARLKPRPGDMTGVEYALDPESGSVNQTVRVLEKPVLLSGADVASASQSLDGQTGQPFVAMTFTPAGARKLTAVTEAGVGRQLAIVVDGRILSVATIHSPITGGKLSLTGQFTLAEVRDYARALSGGPLPERVKLAQLLVDGKPAAPPSAPVVQAPAAKTAPAAPAPEKAIVSDVDAPPPALAQGRSDGVAVVIGVERTRQGLPRADYAARDAKVFADYLVETLGYPRNNVALLLDERAAKSDLDKYFEEWLPRKAGPGSTIVVFFSGHGAPDAVRGTTYLVPYDGDPAFLDKTAYPLKRLYENLGRLKGRRSIVLLDACFSGAGPRSALAKGARPLVSRQAAVEPPGNLAVLSAAASNQIGGAFDAQGHGLFTYFVLKSLRAAAAKGRAPTMQELYDGVSTQVEAQARLLSGNEQTPQLQATPSARAGSL